MISAFNIDKLVSSVIQNKNLNTKIPTDDFTKVLEDTSSIVRAILEANPNLREKILDGEIDLEEFEEEIKESLEKFSKKKETKVDSSTATPNTPKTSVSQLPSEAVNGFNKVKDEVQKIGQNNVEKTLKEPEVRLVASSEKQTVKSEVLTSNEKTERVEENVQNATLENSLSGLETELDQKIENKSTLGDVKTFPSQNKQIKEGNTFEMPAIKDELITVKVEFKDNTKGLYNEVLKLEREENKNSKPVFGQKVLSEIRSDILESETPIQKGDETLPGKPSKEFEQVLSNADKNEAKLKNTEIPVEKNKEIVKNSEETELQNLKKVDQAQEQTNRVAVDTKEDKTKADLQSSQNVEFKRTEDGQISQIKGVYEQKTSNSTNKLIGNSSTDKFNEKVQVKRENNGESGINVKSSVNSGESISKEDKKESTKVPKNIVAETRVQSEYQKDQKIEEPKEVEKNLKFVEKSEPKVILESVDKKINVEVQSESQKSEKSSSELKNVKVNSEDKTKNLTNTGSKDIEITGKNNENKESNVPKVEFKDLPKEKQNVPQISERVLSTVQLKNEIGVEKSENEKAETQLPAKENIEQVEKHKINEEKEKKIVSADIEKKNDVKETKETNSGEINSDRVELLRQLIQMKTDENFNVEKKSKNEEQKIQGIEQRINSENPQSVKSQSTSSENRQSNENFSDQFRNNQPQNENKLNVKEFKVEVNTVNKKTELTTREILQEKPKVPESFKQRLVENAYTNVVEKKEFVNSPELKSNFSNVERYVSSRNLEEIYEKVRAFSLSNSIEEKVTLKLYPKELGEIEIHMRKVGKQIEIFFTAEFEETRKALEKNSALLAERFTKVDFEVRNMEFKTKESAEEQNSRDSSQQFSQNQRENENNKKRWKWVMEDDDGRRES